MFGSARRAPPAISLLLDRDYTRQVAAQRTPRQLRTQAAAAPDTAAPNRSVPIEQRLEAEDDAAVRSLPTYYYDRRAHEAFQLENDQLVAEADRRMGKLDPKLVPAGTQRTRGNGASRTDDTGGHAPSQEKPKEARSPREEPEGRVEEGATAPLSSQPRALDELCRDEALVQSIVSDTFYKCRAHFELVDPDAALAPCLGDRLTLADYIFIVDPRLVTLTSFDFVEDTLAAAGISAVPEVSDEDLREVVGDGVWQQWIDAREADAMLTSREGDRADTPLAYTIRFGTQSRCPELVRLEKKVLAAVQSYFDAYRSEITEGLR